MNTTKHTPGPWEYRLPHRHFVIYRPKSTTPIAEIQGSEADARLIAAAPELLGELEKAHQIIRHALALMTTAQKHEWAERNGAADVDGVGVTRASERLALFEKIEGRASE